jgi:hypothetical protein
MGGRRSVQTGDQESGFVEKRRREMRPGKAGRDGKGTVECHVSGPMQGHKGLWAIGFIVSLARLGHGGPREDEWTRRQADRLGSQA